MARYVAGLLTTQDKNTAPSWRVLAKNFLAHVENRNTVDAKPLLVTDEPERWQDKCAVIDCREWIKRYGVAHWWPWFMLLDHPDAVPHEILYIGLDQVALQPLDPFFDHKSVRMPECWGGRFGKFNSAAVYLPPAHPDREQLAESAAPLYPRAGELKFDETLLNMAIVNSGIRVEPWPKSWVGSYKVGAVHTLTIRNLLWEPPGWDARLLCFHGIPKPTEVIERKLDGWETINAVYP
jgi:hypothetical protein